MRSGACLVGLTLTLAACTTPPDLPSGPAAYSMMPVQSDRGVSRPYLIGALDILSVNVFRVESLSLEGVQVDASGNILYPLLGEVRAAGKTPNQLAAEITSQLGARYLENPQVTVLVTRTTSQNVTVLGAVTEPGIFDLRGSMSLLDALALAKGLQRIAAPEYVVIFRNIDGKRMGALFNVNQIQRGEAPDPEILGKDTVVVGLDNLEAAWRDVLLAAPLATVFTQLR